MKYRFIYIFIIVIITFVVLEAAARILLMRRWSYEKRYELTHHTSERGRFSNHPYLPYVLRTNYKSRDVADKLFSHNSYGFRGKSFEINNREGIRRIVCLGASTTYGIWNSDEETYPAQLEKIFKDNGFSDVEVLNAGVPGWTTMDTFINFYLRVLNTNPDMIILYQGRNDLFPRSFNNFLADYQHYRKPDYSFQYANYFHKYIFRFSNLFLICSYWGDLFGYSRVEENPVYGTIRFINKPTNEDRAINNLSNPQRISVFRRNIESIIQMSKVRKIEVVLSSFAQLNDRFGSGLIEGETGDVVRSTISKQMIEINNTIKDLAQKYRITFVDTASELSNELEDLLVDDCHFNKKGQIARARLFYEHIKLFFQRNTGDAKTEQTIDLINAVYNLKTDEIQMKRLLQTEK